MPNAHVSPVARSVAPRGLLGGGFCIVARVRARSDVLTRAIDRTGLAGLEQMSERAAICLSSPPVLAGGWDYRRAGRRRRLRRQDINMPQRTARPNPWLKRGCEWCEWCSIRAEPHPATAQATDSMDAMRCHHGTEASKPWGRAAVILERLEMAKEHLSRWTISCRRSPARRGRCSAEKSTCRCTLPSVATWQPVLSDKSAPSSGLTCERRCGR